jgi:hypothetical protein
MNVQELDERVARKVNPRGTVFGIGASDGTAYDVLTCQEEVSMANTRAVSEPAQTVTPLDS